MDFNEEKYIDLIVKSLDKTISREEMIQLQGWINESPENQDLFKSIENKRNRLDAYKGLRQGVGQKDQARRTFKKDLQTLVNQENNRGKTRFIPIFSTPIIKFVAAAAVVLIFGVTFWERWFITQPPIPGRTNDLPPGKSQATLTLSNGKTITLADAVPGNLALQGTVKISKIDSSIVSYSSSQDASTAISHIEYNTLTTPKAGQFKIVLNDGSEVWLNAESSLTYPVSFNGKNREVSLTGEAYFKVAKQPEKPFVVKSGDLTVDVLGTSFDLRSYRDDSLSTATLIDGAIRVQADKKSTVLRPEFKITLNKAGIFDVKKDEYFRDNISWVSGRFQFHQASIENIMNQIARWYNVKIVYQFHPLGTFTGSAPRSANASDVLSLIKASETADFRIDGDQIFVIKPKSSMNQ